MRRRFGPLLVTCVASVVAIAVCGTWPAAGSDHDEGAPRVDEATLDEVARYVEARRAELGLPGLAVGIVHGEEAVLLEGFGHTRVPDGAPVGPDTPFLIASLSKPLTASAVMQLVEAGAIDLDEPVSTYLPELRPGGDAVAVRDLLHHRSGLSTRIGQEPISTDAAASLEQNVRRLGPAMRADAPYVYSNANYDALALLVERVSGVPFAAYMRERVFAPLEMDRSFLDPDRAADAGLAQGHYRWLVLGFRPHDAPTPPGLAGSATMFASAEDLTHFLIAQLNGGTYRDSTILSAGSVAVQHEPDLHRPDVGYAMGWSVHPAFPPSAADGHLSDLTLLSHSGHWATYRGVMWAAPEVGLGFVMLTNGGDSTDDAAHLRLSRDVRAILFGLDPPEGGPQRPLLMRWSKHLALILVTGQLLLGVWAIPVVSRMLRGDVPDRMGRVVLSSASGLDVVVLAVALWMPTMFDSTLTAALDFPDLRILLIAAGIGLTWGAIRAAVVGAALLRRARASRSAEAGSGGGSSR